MRLKKTYNFNIMDSVEDKVAAGGLVNGRQANFLEEMKLLKEIQDQSAARRVINSELWHACAGPLVSLPQMGSLVYYFPQGHSEQVAVSTKRTATSQIPNYPNLPSQLMCQIQNITLHADKDTDEIYAQMSLQPVSSEKDVLAMPDFRSRPNKHPSEFFCKTLTASDTSTHGGFSVPRRAAEKLFPPLDFTMQPPTQELVVRDLHDNTWTFRHIYRGQPKRHLLTTGWSLFVGAKRLRAGDAVLFIRDEKSQLLVGIRRADRQQTNLPSSVLSADSMHIGVLAAAAHAAANQSLFTIFYNPRACPSEFVIPVSKYRKAVYGTQLSVGMRFGMMFETEELGKRRFMGSLVGISDLDPLRWPGSKWRNLQVEWDEPACCNKQNRVSSWEIETPESLYIFPSLMSGLKRSSHNEFLGETDWGSLVKRHFRYEVSSVHSLPFNLPRSSLPQESIIKVDQLSNMNTLQPVINQKNQLLPLESISFHNQTYQSSCPAQSNAITSNSTSMSSLGCKIQAAANLEGTKLKSELTTDQLGQLTSIGKCGEGKLSSGYENLQTPLQLRANGWPPMESLIHHSQQMDMPPFDVSVPTASLPSLEGDGCIINTFNQPLSGVIRPPMAGLQDQFGGGFSESINFPLPLAARESWDNQRFLSHANQIPVFSHCAANSNGLRDLSDESNNQSGIYSCPNLDNSNGGSSVVDPSVSSAIVDEYCTLKDPEFQNPSDCLIGNFGSTQDVQSQITCATTSLGHSHARTSQISDISGGTSSDFDESCLLQSCAWKQVVPPLRTYTKVRKTGSVGRSIDVTSFKNYDELSCAIECMFGLEGSLIDPSGSGWKLVYVDYENDVLLVGDDPWEEFVSCVRCIRILSPSEVQQMSEAGMKLLNSAIMQGTSTSCF